MNYRVTPARKLLMEIFSKKNKPFSAQKLLSVLNENSLQVNKTTIYRELDFLLKKGFIKELYINSGKKFYESTSLKHHHHLVCTDCGTIEDIFLEKDMTGEEKRIESEKKFKISAHSLEFFGTCANCRHI